MRTSHYLAILAAIIAAVLTGCSFHSDYEQPSVGKQLFPRYFDS